MGKARIIEALGEGQYIIEIIESRERAEAAKQQAQGRINRNQARITELESEISAAQNDVDTAVAEQNDAINLYQQQVQGGGTSNIDLASYAQAILDAATRRDSLAGEQQVKQVMITSDQALIASVDALPPLRQMQAWCADLTEDLNGEVATAEIPGEIGNVIIKPGFEGNAWSAAEDGAIQPALAGTPAGVFYNLAMMPGWQKWRPTFRIAAITILSGNTCSISLDAASSSQQGLGVNAQSSYSSVPILYMDCNGGAFEEGDKVLVAFAGNVSGPTVVGFEAAPKGCCNPEILATAPSTDTWRIKEDFLNYEVNGTESVQWRVTEGSNNENTLYEGGVTRDAEGVLRLSGLPDEIVLVEEELVSHLFFGESSTLDEGELVGNISIPAIPEYAGGTFYLIFHFIPPGEYPTNHTDYGSVFDTGPIDSAGRAIPQYFNEEEFVYVGYEGESGWDYAQQKGKGLWYIQESGFVNLRLEKRCSSSAEWPE
ncbi:hypothetical protein NYA30BAC_01996 [Halomonas sp. NYA30]